MNTEDFMNKIAEANNMSISEVQKHIINTNEDKFLSGHHVSLKVLDFDSINRAMDREVNEWIMGMDLGLEPSRGFTRQYPIHPPTVSQLKKRAAIKAKRANNKANRKRGRSK